MGDDRCMHERRKPRNVAIVAYPGVQSLDVTGPLEVFFGAQTLIEAAGRRERGYRVLTLSSDGRPLRTSSGLTVVPDAAIGAAPTPIDTLIVAGGAGYRRSGRGPGAGGVDRRDRDRRAAHRIGLQRARSCWLRAGLLDGRRATTHWASAEQLQRDVSAGDGRPRADLRARRTRVDLRRGDRRDGSRAGARRGGPRPRGRTDDRAPPGAVPAPTGQPVAVQRHARLPAAPARAAARDRSGRCSRTSAAITRSRRWQRVHT